MHDGAQTPADEIQRARAFLDSIIENIPDMVLIRAAGDLRITGINRAGELLLGKSRTELLGTTPEEAFPRTQADFLNVVYRKVIETRQIVEVAEEPILTAKGVRILHSKKVPILDGNGQPTHVLSISVDVTESKRAQDAIVALSGRLKDILATVPEILMEVDRESTYIWANQAGLTFFGEEVVGRPAADFCLDAAVGFHLIRPLLEGRQESAYFESLQRRQDGSRRLLAWWSRPLRNDKGRVRGALLSARDITDSRKAEEEKRRLEEQVLASQRMEAIGSLAGGVAHDFNNLLCVLQSYTEFAIRGIRADDPVKDDLLAVKRAGERAAVLTRQLLAFGRKQVLQPIPLNLNDVATGMEKMLRRILGEDIEFTLALAYDLGVVRADRGQLEQVLMNLAANSRDAMPEGGKLAIQTRNVQIDDSPSDLQGPLPFGPYVQISVTDTGCGMDAQTMSRIFDPFFTTKEYGKGTGLGLSTVYGIVKQSQGGVGVASEVGKGTTFSVYLPRSLDAVPTAAALTEKESRAAGHETILLVEDEEDLRRVTRRALEVAGYTVLTAADGDEGLRVAEQYPGEIHLLLTDVVMPRVGGRALAQRLLHTRPGMAVLYMSGYTDDSIIRHGLLDAEIALIGKPFTASALAGKVRELLEKRALDCAARPVALPVPSATSDPVVREGPLPTLPDDIVGRLRKALTVARYDDMLAIVDEVRQFEPAVAVMLRRHLESFDYTALATLLAGSATEAAL